MKCLSFEHIEHNIKNAPVLEDPKDDRDFELASFISPEGMSSFLPEEFSLSRTEFSSVKNQGSRGTCTAHAGVAVSEYFNRKEYNDPNLDLSEEYLFKKTKEIDREDYSYEGYGAYMRSAAKALQKYGTCLESSLPYSGDQREDYWKSVSLSKEHDREALKYKMGTYSAIRGGIEGIKKAIFTLKSPLLSGFLLFESYREAVTTGYIPLPKIGDSKIGGHAMMIIGWTKTHLIVKNSWGLWGDQGYLYWPFEDANHVFSVWSFLDALDPTILSNALIEENKKRVPDWGLAAWEKAINRGIVGPKTQFTDTLTKGEWLVLLDRFGQL